MRRLQNLVRIPIRIAVDESPEPTYTPLENTGAEPPPRNTGAAPPDTRK